MEWTLLLQYIIRLIPAMTVLGLFIFLLPRKSAEFRLAAYILLFVVTRDAMTPLGLWSFGSEGFFWMRFIGNPGMLFVLGALSLFLAGLLIMADADLRRYIVWIPDRSGADVAWGIAGALVVALPFVFFYTGVPVQARGGAVPGILLIPIAVMALCGNFLEETLFRGFFQGYMEEIAGPVRAALLSGAFFAACHIFLAVTVTAVGWPLLAFTLYEGLIASFIRMRFGLIASTLTHGGAIFLIASGIL